MCVVGDNYDQELSSVVPRLKIRKTRPIAKQQTRPIAKQRLSESADWPPTIDRELHPFGVVSANRVLVEARASQRIKKGWSTGQ
jgi:hypothetical protein